MELSPDVLTIGFNWWNGPPVEETNELGSFGPSNHAENAYIFCTKGSVSTSSFRIFLLHPHFDSWTILTFGGNATQKWFTLCLLLTQLWSVLGRRTCRPLHAVLFIVRPMLGAPRATAWRGYQLMDVTFSSIKWQGSTPSINRFMLWFCGGIALPW